MLIVPQCSDIGIGTAFALMLSALLGRFLPRLGPLGNRRSLFVLGCIEPESKKTDTPSASVFFLPNLGNALVRSRVSNPKWAAINYTTFQRFDRPPHIAAAKKIEGQGVASARSLGVLKLLRCRDRQHWTWCVVKDLRGNGSSQRPKHTSLSSGWHCYHVGSQVISRLYDGLGNRSLPDYEHVLELASTERHFRADM